MNKAMVRRTLSALKRLSNQPLSIIETSPEDHSVDYDTGLISGTETVHKVSRPIIVPAENNLISVMDQSYFLANRSFTLGGQFTRSRVAILIDLRDLPRGFKLTTNHKVMIGDDEYSVKNPNTDITNTYYYAVIERVRI